MSKLILDLCGGTGAWSKPYKDAGYKIMNVTLPDHDVRGFVAPSNVYGILAAPPCTVFSLAAWKIPKEEKDWSGGMEIVEACLKIIWAIQCKGVPLRFWALENPTCHLRKFLGHPRFSCQYWEFAEFNETYATKKTDLWGYFNTPKRLIKRRPHFVAPSRTSKPGWYKPEPPDWCEDQILSRADIRSITPAKFAQAFFEANP